MLSSCRYFSTIFVIKRHRSSRLIIAVKITSVNCSYTSSPADVTEARVRLISMKGKFTLVEMYMTCYKASFKFPQVTDLTIETFEARLNA